MSEFATADVTSGKLNALVKTLMSQMGIRDPHEAIRRVNSGEWKVGHRQSHWHMFADEIVLSLVPRGMTGGVWINWFRELNVELGDFAFEILASSGFLSTKAAEVEVSILKWNFTREGTCRLARIAKVAEARKWGIPDPDIACLLLECLTQQDFQAMGLQYIVVPHQPLFQRTEQSLLCIEYRNGVPLMTTCTRDPGELLSPKGGFAYISRIRVVPLPYSAS